MKIKCPFCRGELREVHVERDDVKAVYTTSHADQPITCLFCKGTGYLEREVNGNLPNKDRPLVKEQICNN